MAQGIEIDVIGDSSLFTPLGKGVGYLIRADRSEYLIDCGATPFLALGHDRIARLKGLVATHSHEDHRRWFTDLVLYMHYHPGIATPLKLITSEPIHEEFEKNSRGALERSLSPDSRRVVDVPYSDFVNKVIIGPRARYRIELRPDRCGDGSVWRVIDTVTGEITPPERAKVFVHPAANRPRMLFRDPDTGKWVEPESYYPFSSKVFYFPNRNDFIDAESGLLFKATKSASWHGPPTIGIVIERGEERVAFSSDTVYDPELWKELAEVEYPAPPEASGRAFLEAYIVKDDINRFIQKVWSRERYEEAMRCFDGAIVIHDADFEQSVVHTSHSKLAAFTPDSDWRRLLLTHTPDGFASTFPITSTGKRYHALGGDVFEVVDGRDMPLDGELYFKTSSGELFVGYSNPDGQARLWQTQRGQVVQLGTDEPPPGSDGAKLLGRYEVYIDIKGHYYPAVFEAGASYRTRSDGKVELIRETERGSTGCVAEDMRGKIKRR